MKIEKYIKWFLISLFTVIFVACGGGGGGGDDGGNNGGSEPTKPEVAFTYPESDDVLIHFEQTNGDASGNYTGINEKGESSWYGSIDGWPFTETHLDGLTRTIDIEHSNAVLSHNADATVNYKIYIDDELLTEDSNVLLPSAENSVPFKKMDTIATKISSEDCEERKLVITTAYMVLVATVRAEYYKDYTMCILWAISDEEKEVCETQHHLAYESLRDDVSKSLIEYRGLAEAVEEYKKLCTDDESGDGWVRPDVNFNFVLDIDQDLNKMHDSIYNASICPAWNEDEGTLRFGDTTCMYEDHRLTWEGKSYDKGYPYQTHIYYHDGAESIHKYGESAATSANRTYSLDIYFHDNKHPSSIAVDHLTDGLIFSESYNEDGKLIKTCKGSYSDCTWY